MPPRRIANNDYWFEAFAAGAGVAHDFTRALVAACASDRLPYDLLARSKVLEARAGLILLEVHERLDETFITSIEREDIHLMVTRLVEIVETLTAAVGRMDAFGIDRPTTALRRFCEVLERMAAALVALIGALHTLRPAAVTEASEQVEELASALDDVYRDVQRGYAENHPDARDLLRWKDVYDRLDKAATHARQVARVARHVLMRHS